MEMKESKHRYTEGVSYEDLYEDQKQLKKETEHIEGLSLEAHEEHNEDQIKLKKETDETGSIEILEIKESKDKYFESVSVEAQEEIMDNEVKIDLPEVLTPEVLLPEVLTPEVLMPEVQMSEVLTPEVLLPEVLTPEILTAEVLMSEVLTPEVLPPEVLLPEVLTPEVLTPEGLMAEVLTSNVLMPEGLTPEGLMTEILTPEVLTPEVLTPVGLMSTVLPAMPQLCNVYAKQVVTELPSTSNFEITINNEDINLEAVDLTQPKELIELEEKPKEDIEMVDQIQTPDLTELKEPEEVEGVTLDIQKELYNLETVDLTPEDLIELEVEPKEIQDVSLDIQKELYNLNTVDLTPEEMIEFKVEPKEVEGVSLDVQGKLYNLDTVNLTPGEMLEWKVEPKKLAGVTFDVKKELYNLEAVGFTPEDLIKLEEPKEVEGVSLDIQKELYNLETVKVEGVSLDIEKELYNLDTVDLTPEDLIELEVEPKEVEGVSLDVQGELYNLETIDLMAEELKVEAKDLEGLYVDHEVIDEVVLGPVVLTRPDVMYTRQEVPIETEASWEIPIHYEMKEEPKHYIDVVNFHAQAGYVDDVQNGLLCPEMLQAVDTKQFEGARRPCSVMLERILVDRNRRTCRVGHETYRLRGVVPRWKKGFKFNLSKARLAIQDKLNNINKHTSPQTPPPLKKVLVAGPQSKKSANDESGCPPATSNASFHRIQPRDLPSKKVLFVPPTLGYLPHSSSIPHSNQAPNLPSKNIIVLSYSTKTSRPVKRRYNFKCYFCTETFKTKVSLVEHKSKVHRIKMFNHELDKKKTLKRVKTKSSENVPRAPSPQGGNSQITLDEYLSK